MANCPPPPRLSPLLPHVSVYSAEYIQLAPNTCSLSNANLTLMFLVKYISLAKSGSDKKRVISSLM